MKYAVIADIHANLDALKAVVADATANGVESFVVLGDIVGYGPQPKATLAAIRKIADVVVAGNNDDAVSGRRSADDFNELAAEAIVRHREMLSKEDLDWLRSLPYTAKIDGARITHGDFTKPSDFNYISDAETARLNFAACNDDIMFVGHTHTPEVWFESGAVGARNFTVKGRCIINAGSVGYPREMNGKCVSSYVIYDSTARTITFRYLAFSVASVMQRGTKSRLHINWLATVLLATLVIGVIIGAISYLPSPNTQPLVEESNQFLQAPYEFKLADNTRIIHPNLKLAKNSAPALLTIAFNNVTNSYPVKTRMNKTIKAPKSATFVTLTLTPLNQNEIPEVESFKPCVSAK